MIYGGLSVRFIRLPVKNEIVIHMGKIVSYYNKNVIFCIIHYCIFIKTKLSNRLGFHLLKLFRQACLSFFISENSHCCTDKQLYLM